MLEDNYGTGSLRQIVSAHNGEIEYKSEDGRGTIFKIYLPGAPTSKLTVQ
jgi:signal transduction histidine kinase